MTDCLTTTAPVVLSRERAIELVSSHLEPCGDLPVNLYNLECAHKLMQQYNLVLGVDVVPSAPIKALVVSAERHAAEALLYNILQRPLDYPERIVPRKLEELEPLLSKLDGHLHMAQRSYADYGTTREAVWAALEASTSPRKV